MMREAKARGGGSRSWPARSSFTPAAPQYFGELIRGGYVDVLLAGNALAVHDAEQALFGTSLGVDLEVGTPVLGGHRHHMRAINAINRAGGTPRRRRAGVLTSGIMVDCVTRRRRVRPRGQHPRRRSA